MELQGVFSVFFTENLIPLSMTLCGYRGPCAQTYSREPVLSLTHTWAGLGSGCEEGSIFKHSCMFFCEYVSFLLVKNLGVGVLDHRVSVLFNLMRSQRSHEGSAISAASRVWERRRATAFPVSAAVPSVLGILPRLVLQMVSISPCFSHSIPFMWLPCSSSPLRNPTTHSSGPSPILSGASGQNHIHLTVTYIPLALKSPWWIETFLCVRLFTR